MQPNNACIQFQKCLIMRVFHSNELLEKKTTYYAYRQFIFLIILIFGIFYNLTEASKI